MSERIYFGDPAWPNGLEATALVCVGGAMSEHDRSMGILQQADEERARRKDNPDTWEERKARLERRVNVWPTNYDDEVQCKADIRAALERDDEVKRLIDMAGDWIETDPSLRSTACIEVALDHAKDLDAEAVALRQRVEELERAPRCCADTIPPGCRTCRCADAAEAKLARCVEAADELLSLSSSGPRMMETAWAKLRAALAAARGE